MSKCPIQRAINRLKQFAGMPVPAIIEWISGKPDFRRIDQRKYIDHYQYRLCAVCGTKLTFNCYWIGGERSKDSHYFVDGPMHRQCAELSVTLCPYLNRTRPTFRGDDLKPMPAQICEDRPAKMYLLRGFTSAVEMRQLGPDSVGLWAGDQLTTVKEF